MAQKGDSPALARAAFEGFAAKGKFKGNFRNLRTLVSSSVGPGALGDGRRMKADVTEHLVEASSRAALSDHITLTVGWSCLVATDLSERPPRCSWEPRGAGGCASLLSSPQGHFWEHGTPAGLGSVQGHRAALPGERAAWAQAPAAGGPFMQEPGQGPAAHE